MAKIVVKNSVTSGSAPAGLSLGEIAVNITDKKIFFGNAVESAVAVYDRNAHVLSFNGSTGAVTFNNYVASVNGITGAVGITAGSNITITQSGLTLTISSTSGASGVTGATGATGATGPMPTDYVISINGSTGAITNVARINEGNTFTARQVMNAGITSAGLYITSGSTFDSTIAATSTTNTIDVIASTDGAGLRIAQATTGSSARVGGIRLGRGTSPTTNVYLEGYVGTFRVYNGISGTVAPTGTKMLELSANNGAIFDIPIAGATFSSSAGRITVQKSSYIGSDSGTVRIVGADVSASTYNSDIRANAGTVADTTHTLPAVSGTLLNTASSYVTGVNGITGPVGITAGTNVTITQSGNTLTISASVPGGAGASEAFAIAMAIAL